jgi:hypothetical protein
MAILLFVEVSTTGRQPCAVVARLLTTLSTVTATRARRSRREVLELIRIAV